MIIFTSITVKEILASVVTVPTKHKEFNQDIDIQNACIFSLIHDSKYQSICIENINEKKYRILTGDEIIKTLVDYTNNKFQIFVDEETSSIYDISNGYIQLDGKYFNELPTRIQERIMNSNIPILIIKDDEGTFKKEILYEIHIDKLLATESKHTNNHTTKKL